MAKAYTSRCFYIDDAPESVIKELGVAKSAIFISSSVFDSVLPKRETASQELTVKEALAYDTAITNSVHVTDDRFLKTGNKLVMALTPETYLRAGLEGTKANGQYYAEYNLTTSGKRNDRLKWALHETLTKKYSFDTDSAGLEEWTTAKLPSLVPDTSDDESFQDWANVFVEWCGLVAKKAPALTDQDLDPYLFGHYPDLNNGSAFVLSLKGPLTPQQIAEQLELIKGSWSVAIVSGYENAPNAWNRSHNAGDEAGYILVRHDKTYAFKLVGWNDL